MFIVVFVIYAFFCSEMLRLVGKREASRGGYLLRGVGTNWETIFYLFVLKKNSFKNSPAAVVSMHKPFALGLKNGSIPTDYWLKEGKGHSSK